CGNSTPSPKGLNTSHIFGWTPRVRGGWPSPWGEGVPLPALSPAGAGRVRGQFHGEKESGTPASPRPGDGKPSSYEPNMDDKNTTRAVVPLSVRLWHAIRKAALSVLFAAILVIPKVRRLRRKIWEWSAVRLLVASLGCLLGWRYKNVNGGVGDLVLGVALMAFGLLVRAKPQAKSVDAQARQLDALVVLNGGAFIPAGAERPSHLVSIFVNPDRLFVVDERERTLEEIPVVRVRELTARPLPAQGEPEAQARTWDLEIIWESKEMRTARFRYDGVFAEHLARVAETTVRNLLRNDLPVLREQGIGNSG